MKLYMHHGRLTADGNPTTIEGVENDDWGFNREPLDGVIGFHVTYGTMRVFFDTIDACQIAQRATGWQRGHGDTDLEVLIVEDCISALSGERNRQEYFGDWGMK